MSNDVKWTDWRSFDVAATSLPVAAAGLRSARLRSAWLQLGGCVVGLAVLAAALPDPRAIVDVLSGAPISTAYGSSAGSTAQAAILAAAGLLVWVLLIWSIAICAAAVLGRLPGSSGLLGRSLLRRIAPASAGRLVAVAVGVSLLAGTSACAAPAGSLPDSASSSVPGDTAALVVASASAGDGSGAVDAARTEGSITAPSGLVPQSPAGSVSDPSPPATGEVFATIVIDWPDAAEPTIAVGASPGAATPSSTPTTTDAPAPTGSESPVSSAVDESASTTSPSAVAPNPPTPSPDPPSPDPPSPDTPNQGTPSPASPNQGTPGPPSPSQDTPSPAPLRPAPLVPSDDDAVVTVRTGDSLWSIAAIHLLATAGQAGVTDADIDSAWRAWYFANTQVIGDDPDLIQPGQLLLPPNPK